MRLVWSNTGTTHGWVHPLMVSRKMEFWLKLSVQSLARLHQTFLNTIGPKSSSNSRLRTWRSVILFNTDRPRSKTEFFDRPRNSWSSVSTETESGSPGSSPCSRGSGNVS